MTMAPIKLYNTLTRKVEEFTPLKEGRVSMYSCGPTVYDTPHVANYRTFVMNEVLKSMFEYNGLSVDHVMNITDVDDKTIRRSRKEGVALSAVTRKYEEFFLEGLKAFKVAPPKTLVRATDHIGDMIALISDLLEKGVAYKADDGVYMSVDKVKDYGALAGMVGKGASRARISNDEYDKEDPSDFALWKFKVEEDGDVSWPAPFGEGRPGWHIECSAMAMKMLGPTIDVHTGGSDLIFPHHTNEIAQSESATGVQFARYWVHFGMMTMNSSKMSKSKGNVTKLEDLAANSISPVAYRYWLLTAHYRSPMDFSYEAVQAAQNALIRLMRAVSDAGSSRGAKDSAGDGSAADVQPIPEYVEKFREIISDDLDTPKAVALAWDLLKDEKYTDAEKRATLLDFDRVFGLGLADVPVAEGSDEIPPEIEALAAAREEARKSKDWEKSDALRNEIESRGYEVRDTPEGIKISLKPVL